MKITIQFFTAAVIALMFTSCSMCKLGQVGYIEGEKQVITTVDSDSKGGLPITTVKTVPTKQFCYKCGSSYCPKPQCCGIISREVTSRATGQGGTGEPFIGLIPTMKTLAPPLKK